MQQNSLDAFLSFVIAASETSNLRFGPMVTPVTFRRPVDVGRMAAQLDILSGGRFVMGLGAGWNQAEHDTYGLDFPPTRERFERLEDMIHLLQALWAPGEATYARRLLHAGRRRLSAQAGGGASADSDRRRRREAHAPARRSVRQ